MGKSGSTCERVAVVTANGGSLTDLIYAIDAVNPGTSPGLASLNFLYFSVLFNTPAQRARR